MTITLRNDFHSRTVRVRIPKYPHTLTPAQAARVRRELCGHRDCTCGVIRGRQEVDIYPDGDRQGRATWTITGPRD